MEKKWIDQQCGLQPEHFRRWPMSYVHLGPRGQRLGRRILAVPDGNWGTADGLSIPPGATAVVFTAWGEQGNEIVTFGAGMGDVDGFSQELSNVALDSTPQEYVIDLTDISYELVVGGFVWTAAQSDGPMTFHIENIRWIETPETIGCACPA